MTSYMEAYQATKGDAMNSQKRIMSVLAQITSWIQDRIIENLAKLHKIQTRSFSATSHVISMVYAHLAHAAPAQDVPTASSPSMRRLHIPNLKCLRMQREKMWDSRRQASADTSG